MKSSLGSKKIVNVKENIKYIRHCWSTKKQFPVLHTTPNRCIYKNLIVVVYIKQLFFYYELKYVLVTRVWELFDVNLLLQQMLTSVRTSVPEIDSHYNSHAYVLNFFSNTLN